MHGPDKLPRRRCVGIEVQLNVLGGIPVGAPVATVLSGLRVEDDHSLVGVAVGDEELVRLGIHDEAGGPAEVARVVAPARHPRLADRENVLTAPRELVDQVGVVDGHPDEVVVIDIDRVLPSPPLAVPRSVRGLPERLALSPDRESLACGRTGFGKELPELGPCLNHVPLGVELDHRRSRPAALRFALDRGQLPATDRPRPVDHPDVPLAIHSDAPDLAQDPLIRERQPGPGGIVHISGDPLAARRQCVSPGRRGSGALPARGDE